MNEEKDLALRTIKLARQIKTVAAYFIILSVAAFFSCGIAGILTGTTLFYRVAAAGAFVFLCCFIIHGSCNFGIKELDKELEEME